MKKKSKWRPRLLWLGGILVLINLSFWGDYNFYNLFRLKKKTQDMTQRIADGVATRDSLATEVEQLETSDAHIERIAREKYKMAKSDETVYVFKDKDRE